MSHDHDHTHEESPRSVQQVAYRELSAQYGVTVGELMEARTRVQFLAQALTAAQTEIQRLSQGEPTQEVSPLDGRSNDEQGGGGEALD